MKKYNVSRKTPTVRFGDREYAVCIPETRLLFLHRCFTEAVSLVDSPETLDEAMRMGADVIGAALGEGTLAQIAGDRPTTLELLTGIENAIVCAAADALERYCAEEYEGGGRFSLACAGGRIELPESVNGYAVNTDFRLILLVLKALGDAEFEDMTRAAFICRYFFREELPEDPFAGFAWFVNCGRTYLSDGGSRDFDFEQDAQELYCAFLQVYGIDLIRIPYLHWWEFSALLIGICSVDNALSNKIRLRTMGRSESERKTALARACEQAALKEQMRAADHIANDCMIERLKNGQDVKDLLERG